MKYSRDETLVSEIISLITETRWNNAICCSSMEYGLPWACSVRTMKLQLSLLNKEWKSSSIICWNWCTYRALIYVGTSMNDYWQGYETSSWKRKAKSLLFWLQKSKAKSWKQKFEAKRWNWSLMFLVFSIFQRFPPMFFSPATYFQFFVKFKNQKR